MAKSNNRRERCKKMIRANLSMDRDTKDSFYDLYGVNINQLINEQLNSFTKENYSYKEIQKYYKEQNKQLKEKIGNIAGLVFLDNTFNHFAGE